MKKIDELKAWAIKKCKEEQEGLKFRHNYIPEIIDHTIKEVLGDIQKMIHGHRLFYTAEFMEEFNEYLKVTKEG